MKGKILLKRKKTCKKYLLMFLEVSIYKSVNDKGGED